MRRPYDETVEAVRAELATAGVGILSEIDLKATLKAKLDARLKSSWAPAVPSWRTRHCRRIPSIAALLPCNVVVRAIDDTTTVVVAFDPDTMMSFAAHYRAGDTLRTVATDARQRPTAALTALENN